jgi:N utilization substance protein B
MSRKKAREEVMIAIYQMELKDHYDLNACETTLENKNLAKKDFDYAYTICKEFLKDMSVVDDQIEKHLKKWTLNRIGKIDLAVLRVAVVEFFYFDDIPIEVSINEAIEMAKKYSDQESANFINGVLASIVDERNLIDE